MYVKFSERKMQEAIIKRSDIAWQNVAYCREKGWVKVRENFPQEVITELKSEG